MKNKMLTCFLFSRPIVHFFSLIIKWYEKVRPDSITSLFESYSENSKNADLKKNPGKSKFLQIYHFLGYHKAFFVYYFL